MGGKAVRAGHSLCNAGGLAGWFVNNNSVSKYRCVNPSNGNKAESVAAEA